MRLFLCVEEKMEYILKIQFFGGRGASAPKVSGSKGDGNGNEPDESERDFVSRINRMFGGNKQSLEHMLDNFRQFYAEDKREHLITVDDEGFVHDLIHGNKGSVSALGSDLSGRTVIHNHPDEGGAFSYNDLRLFAQSNAKTMVASDKDGDYIIKKGNNFNSQLFMLEINKRNVPVYNQLSNGSTIKDYSIAQTNYFKKKNILKKLGITYEHRTKGSPTKTLDVKTRNTVKKRKSK